LFRILASVTDIRHEIKNRLSFVVAPCYSLQELLPSYTLW